MKKILVATAVAAAFGVSGVQAAEDITVDVAVIGAGRPFRRSGSRQPRRQGRRR